MQYFDFDGSLIEADKYKEVCKSLQSYFETLAAVVQEGGYTKPECSINCAFDSSIFESVAVLAKQVATHSLKYIFVVGIGGSALGTKAVYEVLKDEREESAPEIIFLEGPDPHTLSYFQKHLFLLITSTEEILIVLISKSGSTIETTVNFEWLYSMLYKNLGDGLSGRVVVVSDKSSALFSSAQEKGWHTLTISEKVGGRYSVLTPVGLFPLLVAGFDVQAFIQGAKSGREQALVFNNDNPYLQQAVTRYIWYTSGFTIETLFLFSAKLKGFAGWYRQLTAESLGKKSLSTRAPVALLPEIAYGPEDLHSIEQLYLGSLRTQSTIFLSVKDVPQVSISDQNILGKQEIVGKNAGDIMQAIQTGVERAYMKNGKPFMKTQLATLNPFDLGEYMQGVMIETMLLAHLLDVNAFDQPDVEHYKKETQAILQQS